jgi:hypothetical protein
MKKTVKTTKALVVKTGLKGGLAGMNHNVPVLRG